MVVVIPARSTSDSEIATAIQELISTYPLCAAVPSLRLVGKEVDFDPTSKEARRYEGAEQVLDVLAQLGYLTKSARPDVGEKVAKYDRSEKSRNEEAIFYDRICLPADRKLVSISKVERVTEFARWRGDGYLTVDFSHVPAPESIWLREPALVRIFEESFLPVSDRIHGNAKLSRVWIREEHPLKGAPHNGVLWALKYDGIHKGYEGGRWGALVFQVSSN